MSSPSVDGNLYEQMLQHQSWLGMLNSEQDSEASDAGEHEPRNRPCGGSRSCEPRGVGRCHRGFQGFPGGPRGPPCGSMPFMQMFLGQSNGPPFSHFGPHHGRGHAHGPHHPVGPPPTPSPHGAAHHHGLHSPPPPFGVPPHISPNGPHPPRGLAPKARGRCGGPLPFVDVLQEQDHYVLLADVPGFDKKDVVVTVSDKVLTIKGELPTPGGDADAQRLFSERRSINSFNRSFQLSDDIDATTISAKLVHGVLRIVLLQKAAAQPTVIPVAGGGSSEAEENDFVDVDDNPAAA